MNVFLRNSRAGVGDADADEFAVQRRDVQVLRRSRHRILGIEKQIQEHLLQAPGVALNRRQILVEFGLHLMCATLN